MKKFKLLPVLFSVVVILISSHFVAAQVKSDHDKETDFSMYKTYSFEGWQKNSDQQLNEFDKKRILQALKSEFEARGMVHSEDNADAKIALYVVLDQKTSTTAYTDFMGGYGYGPRWGWGLGAGNVTATTTYSDDDYTEGTLVVDMYDVDSDKLVWQGILTSRVTEKPEKRDRTIPKNIKKLMKKFPVDKM
ncbi:DUF4136 domain-containing protein [Echinicola vietnamensis]|uniref:DUF4136 domain-containing protein n=1 Tax=Echinicola vietnamensis (strain DSM 17526 / LMG 23754 / KMM 6221) TaxID=926556 RepID=L0FZT1_ECHVK|nr:DUF4136 domain-containing protein [Echinicola vietnamensis]AGA78817.1 hypothetical protein Echvi_2575 [Echinicola vietnamensis DSM 17526]